jgi:nickel/cobalt exporter
MTTAVLMGVGAGALHAVTGPDHVLSVGPVAVRATKPWQVGLRWGLGHAVGTLALALPVLAFSTLFDLEGFAVQGERIAGLALLLMAASAWRQLRHREDRADDKNAPGDDRTLVVGFVHGITGGASLMLALPVVLGTSTTNATAWLVAFGVGSTIAMAALTSAVARWGKRLSSSTERRLQYAMCGLSALLGVAWLA